MSDLTTALVIAAQAHHGQVDLAGDPFVLHPLRVMLKGKTEEERIVRVLHDLLENCWPGWSAIALRAHGFSERIVAALVAISRLDPEHETYLDYITRCSRNELARGAKIDDLQDNIDRLHLLEPGQASSLKRRYLPALATLQFVAHNATVVLGE